MVSNRPSVLLEKKIEPRFLPFHNTVLFIWVYRILVCFSVSPAETVLLKQIFIETEKITL